MRILLQLMLPFVVGHLSRPWIAGWLHQRKQVLGFVDRGSILLVVYTAFSAAVIAKVRLNIRVDSAFTVA